MRVLVDGIHIGREMKGVGRYLFNSLKKMAIMDQSLKFDVLLIEGAQSYSPPETDCVRWIWVTWRNHVWHGFKTLPLWVRRLGPDVVWIPYETPVGLINRPYVMVCHDVPEKIRDAQKKAHRKCSGVKGYLQNCIDDVLIGRSLRRSRLVFSNSHYVAQWLEKIVGISPSRIKYAPCAPGADFFYLSQGVDVHAVREKLNSPEGYILTFYTGDSRENFAVVPMVYQQVVDGAERETLVVAGVRNDARAFVESSLSNFPWRDRVRIIPFLESGKEKELAEIYAAASVYLDPSLQEGFGMQVIEAMACGTPVVCSNRGALPEVAGNAALLVDPENLAEMASAVKKVLRDERLQMQLKSHGHQRAASFSWEDTAKVICQGLIEVVHGKERGKSSSRTESSYQ
jgi:glycosyltransferase involved in cell wall biosynthesis